MNVCPQCGNEYRDDVDRCPNDGSALGLAPPASPPPGPPPPAVSTAPPNVAPPTGPKPRSAPLVLDDEPLPSTSGAGTWIAATLVCLAMVAVFFWAREKMATPTADESAQLEELDADDDSKKAKRKKKRRSPRKDRRGSAPAERGDEYADYDWEQDYEVDDLVLGDVRSEGELLPPEPTEAAPPPPPYEPTKEEWQADGSYRPTASWGSIPSSGVTVLDLQGGGPTEGLDEGAVSRVLNARTVQSCYSRWVDKIPQMRGRVDLTVAVKPNGAVGGVRVTASQLRSRVVEKCIVARVRGLKFPPPANGQAARFDTHFDFTNM